MADDLLSTLQSFIKERLSLTQREKQLIDALNQMLPGLGYRIVPNGVSKGKTAGPAERGRAEVVRDAKTKSLACPHCERRFGRPLHLGRHISAMHKTTAARQPEAKTDKGVQARTKRGAKKAA